MKETLSGMRAREEEGPEHQWDATGCCSHSPVYSLLRSWPAGRALCWSRMCGPHFKQMS